MYDLVYYPQPTSDFMSTTTRLMDTRQCLICTVPISVTHMGFDAWRACAAFFKRTHSTARAITCRQGERKCAFRKHMKFTCRSCRYDRCLRLGMTYEVTVKKESKRDEVEMPHSWSSASTSSTSDSMLDRMETEYKAAYDRRLVQETQYLAKHKLKRMAHPTEEIFISNVSSYCDILRILINESITILRNVFEEFEYLSGTHKVTLLKNFLGRLVNLEGIHISKKYFKNDFNFMTSLKTCLVHNNVEGWVSEEDHIEKIKDFRIAVKSFSKDYMQIFTPMLKMDEFTNREFHALIILAYCDVDSSLELPEEIVETMRRTRTQLFKELQDYYRHELGLKDFSNRLCTLMTAALGVGEAGNLFYEELRMYSAMFGVLSEDQYFLDLFVD